ncbi:uncharacterized protein [Antedon mediterranea]|uniref:uncharacterized protein n=1 Tax=Antedon mediterranea TaxID=105859 RepID=UPI003AF97FF8
MVKIRDVNESTNKKKAPKDCGFLRMTNLGMTVFWIRSIYEYAVVRYRPSMERRLNGVVLPPIILVGTHKDKVKGRNEAEKIAKIEAMGQEILEAIKDTPYEKHVDPEIYMVDSKSRRGIEKLKKRIGVFMNGMRRKIPIKWVDLQTKIQELAKTKLLLSLNEITKIANESEIADAELTMALDYLNDTGNILYSKNEEKLKHVVLINLQTMVEMVTEIFTDKIPEGIGEKVS